MIKHALSLVCCVLLMPASFGQEVGSKAYKLMLNMILDRSVPEVSVNEVAGKRVIFLDAREAREYQTSKIDGALWVGYEDFSTESVSHIGRDEAIVVYCSVGYRSEKVAEKLRQAGFSNVSNLYGGIFEWKNQNLPVTDSTGRETEYVHAYSRIWGVWLQKGRKVYK